MAWHSNGSGSRRAALTWLVSFVAAVAVAVGTLPATTLGESAARRASPSYADVQPAALDAVVAASEHVPTYRIDADLAFAGWDAPARISGAITIDWVNRGPGAASLLPLRVYPNAPVYGGGNMTVTDVAVDGTPVAVSPSVDGTVLEVPMPNPIAPGNAVALSAHFETTVPVDSTAAFGIFSVKQAARSMALGHWYPMLAGSDDAGWSLEPISRNGDPIFSPAALYDVTLRSPETLDLVASGVEVTATTSGGTVERHFVAGPVRDVAIIAGDGWSSATAEIDGISVTAYADDADGAANDAVLAAATHALAAFGDRFGPYPYRELDIVRMDLAGAAGMEFPGLVLVGTGVYGSILGPDSLYAETVVAHEVAHQWWYGIVGSNNHRHAFIDEGLSEFAGVAVYLESRYGPGVAATVWNDEVLGWWERSFARDGDLVVDSPTDAFANRTAYASAVYPKAALGFAALRAAIGDDAFFSALAALARDRAFAVVEPSEVRRAFESACGCNVRPLWRTWFESASWSIAAE